MWEDMDRRVDYPQSDSTTKRESYDPEEWDD